MDDTYSIVRFHDLVTRFSFIYILELCKTRF